jgi:hypothetical protein
MSRAWAAAPALFAVPLLVGATAQTPDFSGTWRLDAAGVVSTAGRGGRRGLGTGPGGGLGLGPPAELVTIRQDGSALIAEEPDGVRITYRLDGEAVLNTIAVGGGAARGVGTYRSRWEDGSLVTAFTVRVPNGVTRDYREVRSLAPEGAMIVELSATGASARRVTYRKSP